LGMISMLEVTSQFFLGFTVIIIAFSISFSILYGSTAPNWSNFNQFFSATQNALAGYGNTVENDGFAPYLYFWFGDAMILLYLVITGIVCINMLIALMGNMFNNLVDKQVLKRQRAFAKGDIYMQTEKFLLPPPFNLLHLIVLGTTYFCWDQRRFKRWEPKSHNDAYSVCMILKEMYLLYRKEEIVNNDFFEFNDNDDDDSRLSTTNVKLLPFVNKFFISRRPKQEEFLQHYVEIAVNKKMKTLSRSKIIRAPTATSPVTTITTTTTTTTITSITETVVGSDKDEVSVELDEVIGEEEGTDQVDDDGNDDQDVEVDDGDGDF